MDKRENSWVGIKTVKEDSKGNTSPPPPPTEYAK